EQRTHRWRAFGAGEFHLLHDVGTQTLAEEEQFTNDAVSTVAETPNFIRASTRGIAGFRMRERTVAPAVQTEQWAENAVLKPAHDEFLKIRRVHFTAEETANVGRPPWDTAQADVQSGTDLLLQIFPRRVNVARPDGRAVTLAARKARTTERDDFRFARRFHAFVESLLLHHRIKAADFEAVAGVIADVVVVVVHHLWLNGVEPPDFDAGAKIVFAHFMPKKFPCVGMRGVKQAGDDGVVRVRVSELDEAVQTALGANEEIAALQFGKIFAVGIHRRPHGNHDLDAEQFEFAHHRGRIRPARRVELPFAHFRPVEIINHDDGHRQAAPLVFARDSEQFVLRLVAELALPETRRPLRQHWGAPGQIRVTLHDARIAVAGRDDVINQARGVGDPTCLRASQFNAAHAGIVPEQTVATTGDKKRNRDLRIAMRE